MRLALSRAIPRRRRIWPSISSIFALVRSRRALRALTAEQLLDVGITAEDAQAEARRPVWDAPASWKR